MRFWALAWFLALAPLVLLSFVSASFTADLSARLLDTLGVHRDGSTLLLSAAALVLTMLLNFLVMHLMLGRLGGIRPARGPLLVGAAVGAVVIELLKQLMALLVSFVIDKPQYGALSAPIGIMFVLYLQSSALYLVASLTAPWPKARSGRHQRARRGQHPEPGRVGALAKASQRHDQPYSVTVRVTALAMPVPAPAAG